MFKSWQAPYTFGEISDERISEFLRKLSLEETQQNKTTPKKYEISQQLRDKIVAVKECKLNTFSLPIIGIGDYSLITVNHHLVKAEEKGFDGFTFKVGFKLSERDNLTIPSHKAVAIAGFYHTFPLDIIESIDLHYQSKENNLEAKIMNPSFYFSFQDLLPIGPYVLQVNPSTNLDSFRDFCQLGVEYLLLTSKGQKKWNQYIK